MTRHRMEFVNEFLWVFYCTECYRTVYNLPSINLLEWKQTRKNMIFDDFKQGFIKRMGKYKRDKKQSLSQLYKRLCAIFVKWLKKNGRNFISSKIEKKSSVDSSVAIFKCAPWKVSHYCFFFMHFFCLVALSSIHSCQVSHLIAPHTGPAAVVAN